MEHILKIINPMTSTVFWSIIVFILLFILIWRFVVRPINRILTKRQQEIRASMDNADRNRMEAQKLLQEQQKYLEDAKKEAHKIIEESKIAAMNTKNEIEKKAMEKSKAIMDAAMEEIDFEKKRSVMYVKNQISSIAIDIAERIINEHINPGKHEELIEESLRELEKL